jgi:hypothetical protein
MATFSDPRHLIDEVSWQINLDWGNLPAAMVYRHERPLCQKQSFELWLRSIIGVGSLF